MEMDPVTESAANTHNVRATVDTDAHNPSSTIKDILTLLRSTTCTIRDTQLRYAVHIATRRYIPHCVFGRLYSSSFYANLQFWINSFVLARTDR